MIEHIYVTITRMEPSEIVDLLPFIGPAYEIEQGLWHGNWGEIAEGAVRLAVDGIFVWLGGLAGGEISVPLEKSIMEARPSTSITPAVSMLRDFHTDMQTLSRSVAPLGVEGAIDDVGASGVYELHYAEEGEGALLAGRNARPPVAQYKVGPPTPGEFEPSRSVHDVKNVMKALAEADAIPEGLDRGFAACLPTVRMGLKSGPPVLNMDDLLWSDDVLGQSRIRELQKDINLSPLARRLAGFSREIGGGPFEVAIASRNPETFLNARKITLAPDRWIAQKSYMAATGPTPFQPESAMKHEWIHSALGYTDNPGVRPDLERGVIVTLENHMDYEANRRIPPRIMYASENRNVGRTDTLALSIPRARLRALAQDRALAPYFDNAHEPDLEILGTPAKQRITVLAMKDVAKRLLARFSERLHAYAPLPKFDEERAAIELLDEKLGISRCDVYRRRKYFITEQHVGRVPFVKTRKRRLGSPLEEFFSTKSDAFSTLKTMTVGDRSLHVIADLEIKRSKFVEALPSSPLALAKAEEALRLNGYQAHQKYFPHLAKVIVKQSFKETPSTRSFASGMDVFMGTLNDILILNPLVKVGEVLDTGGVAEFIGLIPVVGSAYQIGHNVLLRDWKGVATATVSLGVDLISVGLSEMAEREIAETAEQIVRQARPTRALTPAASMLRTLHLDSRARDPSILPLGMDEVGESQTFVMRYQEDGAGHELDAGDTRLPKSQYRTRPLSGDGIVPSRTVHDVKRIYEAIEESEFDREPCSSPFGIKNCLPTDTFEASIAAPRNDIDDLLHSEDEWGQARIRTMGAILSASVNGRRNLEWARTIGMPRYRLNIVDLPPETSFVTKTITMPKPNYLANERYVSMTGPRGFETRRALLHEFEHAVTQFLDNAGEGDAQCLNRGPIIPIVERILYEANMPVPARISYRRDYLATENLAANLEAKRHFEEARFTVLREDEELSPLFLKRHGDLKEFSILGTQAKRRLTVRGAKDVTRELKANGFSSVEDGLDLEDLKFELSLRMDVSAESSTPMSVEFDSAFRQLCRKNPLFANLAERWVADQSDTMGSSTQRWKFYFDKPRGDKLDKPFLTDASAPWVINDEWKTIRLFSGDTYYSGSLGPRLVTMKMRIVQIFTELVYGDLWPSVPTEMRGLNRGRKVLMENAILDSGEKSAVRRVNAEFYTTPEPLWENIALASTVARDEDFAMAREIGRFDKIRRVSSVRRSLTDRQSLPAYAAGKSHGFVDWTRI